MKSEIKKTVRSKMHFSDVPRTDSLCHFCEPLDILANSSPSLLSSKLTGVDSKGEEHELRRYLHIGLRGGDAPIKLGIFAGIHGDEVAAPFALRRFIRLLEDYPEVARGFCLFVYPVCNPTGFIDRTRLSRNGRDLNREFWRNSSEPDVVILERELREQSFHGIISLHSDDTSDGLYGFVAGSTLTRHLLRPALREASSVLPLNEKRNIDGFQAGDGIIHQNYEGVLRAPPNQRPKPFEIILETPQTAPQFLQEQAFLIALEVILRKYRELIAFAPNL